MSLEITTKYITPKSILLCIENYQILLDVPSFDQVEEIEIDWGKVDYILLSSYSTAASIVYIAEYTKFSGMIFATEPTIAYSRLLSQEFLLSQKNGAPLFNMFDIVESHERINRVFFNAPIHLSANLMIQACSSGAFLGGSNWIIKFGSIEVAYIAEALKKPHLIYRQMDVPILIGKDLLIVRTPAIVKKTVYNKRLIDLWPIMESYIKKRGTILFPTQNIQHLFSLAENLYHILDSTGIQRPIHILSNTAKQAIIFSNIFSEWMSKAKQELSLQARVPLLVAALLEKRHILCHSTVQQSLSYTEPRLIICTKEFNLVELFHSLSNSCVILSDSSFKVPDHSVYYYDEDPNELMDLKEIMAILKPRNTFLGNDQQYFKHNWDCSVSNDILEKPLIGGMYLPVMGTLDLHTNHLKISHSIDSRSSNLSVNTKSS